MVHARSAEGHALFLIRLLLGEAKQEEFESVQNDWTLLYGIMKRNAVLIRSCTKLKQAGVEIPAEIQVAAAEESRRIEKTVGLIGEIGSLCQKAGLDYIFPKAFQHYPDMGHDVDLLVANDASPIDLLIAEKYGACLSPGSLLDRISGKTGGQLPGFPSPVEIHHGRMGHLGECREYPGVLLGNKRTFTVNRTTGFVPSADDQVIIQAMQRIYGHFSIRLTDAIHVIHLIRKGDLDWNYIKNVSSRIGIYPGLKLYLGQLDSIHRLALAVPLPIPSLKDHGSAKRQRARFKGTYRIPRIQVAKAYLLKLLFYLRTERWASAGRLSLLPLMATISALRALWTVILPRSGRS